LLVTDGTVTQALEAYFNTKVHVQLLQQGRSTVLQEFFHQPKIPIADPMLRQVQLVRADTQSVLVQAESIIALNLLPLELAEGLLAGQLGIGDLIRAQSLDTYRQLLDLGINERAGKIGVWRTYAICHEHTALMQVQEWFPWEVFKNT
jgi:chorismate-pyruvate lyase